MVTVELAVDGVMVLLQALAVNAWVESMSKVYVALTLEAAIVMAAQVMLPVLLQPVPKAEPSVV